MKQGAETVIVTVTGTFAGVARMDAEVRGMEAEVRWRRIMQERRRGIYMVDNRYWITETFEERVGGRLFWIWSGDHRIGRCLCLFVFIHVESGVW